ncbi:MAG: hypothetical protein AAFP15_02070 [Bacteroidota bacterium]
MDRTPAALKAECQRLGITTAELALLSGYTRKYVSLYLRGGAVSLDTETAIWNAVLARRPRVLADDLQGLRRPLRTRTAA